MKNDQPSPNLRAVDAHLERGDYGQALELLTPLMDIHPISTPAGSQVRFLMITSWMGQGQDEQALTMARALSRSGDVDKRQQAKQLVDILDAPSLERPDSWTMRLPALEVTATGGSPPAVSSQRRSSSRKTKATTATTHRSHPGSSRWICRRRDRRAGRPHPFTERLRSD